MDNKLGGINQQLYDTNTVHSLRSIARIASRGFTIVELLIVVVIIGILATIVIVAYTGVTNKAKASKSQAAATLVAKKANMFSTLTGSYPGETATPTTGFSTTSPSGSFVSIQNSGIAFAAIASGTTPSTENTVEYAPCAGTGAQISWYDYTKTSAQKTTQTIGTCTTPSTVWTGGPY